MPDIYLLMILLLLCGVCGGCTNTPPPLTTDYGLPADKYDYLIAAVATAGLVKQEPNDRDILMRTSRTYYQVWNQSDRFRFDEYPSSWTEEDIQEIRSFRRQRALSLLLTYLADDQPVTYESAVRQAITKLKAEGGSARKHLSSDN